MDCSMPTFPVLRCLLEFAQTHVHWVGDAIHTSHPLSMSSVFWSQVSCLRNEEMDEGTSRSNIWAAARNAVVSVDT